MVKVENSFVVRTPLLPCHPGTDLSPAGLKIIFREPILQEALFFASSTLYETLLLFLDDRLDKKASQKAANALRKYYLRASCRCTPFGLFASVSHGKWSEVTTLRLSNKLVRKTVLNGDVTAKLVAHLLTVPAIADGIKYYPNGTIYEIGTQFRFISINRSSNLQFYLSEVEKTDLLKKLLTGCSHGLIRKELIALAQGEEVTHAEAIEFAEQLIDSGILMSELAWRITGKAYFTHVSDVLLKYQPSNNDLKAIETLLSQADRQDFTKNLSLYAEIKNRLARLMPIDNEQLFQVDSFRPGNITLDRQIAAKIERIVGQLCRLPVPVQSELRDFKKRFSEKYGGTTVDLCTCLDPEIGLSYSSGHDANGAGSCLLQTVSFETPAQRSSHGAPHKYHEFILKKYNEALSSDDREVHLCESELARFKQEGVLATTMFAFFSLRRGDVGACPRIDFKGAFGPSAPVLLARFCHLNRELEELVRVSITAEETRTDAIYAEIVHVNQARISNISTRPVLRKYEIPILASSSVDDEQTIPLNDLTLTMVGDQLVLRSKKLNREVIARMSSAHNYTEDTISAFRLLCDLQFQDTIPSVTWDWGILTSAPFLPRVVFEDVVIAPARWTLSEEDANDLRNSTEIAKTMKFIADKLKLPKQVLVGQGDNKIPIDLTDIHQLVTFQSLTNSGPIAIEEWVDSGPCFEGDIHGLYANEIIAPLRITEQPKVTPCVVHNPNADPGLPRSFLPGTEWLYYKLYCNESAANRILVEFIRPLVDLLLGDGIVDRWFLIRYADPAPHIRLRFHGNGTFYFSVMKIMVERLQPTIDLGLISSVCVDTYEREIERYGVSTMLLSEELFFADSMHAMSVIETFGDEDNVYWQVALAKIDSFLTWSGFSLQEKYDLIEGLRIDYLTEMGKGDTLIKSLQATRRINRGRVEAMLNNTHGNSDVTKLSAELEHTMKNLAMLAVSKFTKIKFSQRTSFIQAHIHMMINRIFTSNHRQYETILYDFLSQHYRSMLARSRRTHDVL